MKKIIPFVLGLLVLAGCTQDKNGDLKTTIYPLNYTFNPPEKISLNGQDFKLSQFLTGDISDRYNYIGSGVTFYILRNRIFSENNQIQNSLPLTISSDYILWKNITKNYFEIGDMLSESYTLTCKFLDNKGNLFDAHYTKTFGSGDLKSLTSEQKENIKNDSLKLKGKFCNSILQK